MMYKKLLLAATFIAPLFANAASIDKDGNEIVSLRYSEATTAGDTRPIFGMSFSHIRGAGELGFTISADFQNFDEDGNYIDGAGQEKQEFQFYNIMGGLTYGVTDEFYVMPKVGFSYSKIKDFSAEEKCSPITGCTGKPNYINSTLDEDYRISYGIDFMLVHESLAYGVGVTDVSYFGERETMLNLNLGYKF
ncbi:hypothetical protein [Vibrio harveyi]